MDLLVIICSLLLINPAEITCIANEKSTRNLISEDERRAAEKTFASDGTSKKIAGSETRDTRTIGYLPPVSHGYGSHSSESHDYDGPNGVSSFISHHHGGGGYGETHGDKGHGYGGIGAGHGGGHSGHDPSYGGQSHHHGGGGASITGFSSSSGHGGNYYGGNRGTTSYGAYGIDAGGHHPTSGFFGTSGHEIGATATGHGLTGAEHGLSGTGVGHGHGGGGHGIVDYKKLALKGILIPLAGIALLGAAAALTTNPVLLQLGVLNGRRRRRRSIPDYYLPGFQPIA